MPILLHGIIPAGTTRCADAPDHDLIICDQFSALVSGAPPELNNLPPEAIADLALTHNAILVAYCTVCAVLPMRFGAAFSSVDVARQHLLADAASNIHALDAVSDLREYTVRLMVTRDPPMPERTVQTGRDFLTKGRDLRDRRKTLSDDRSHLAHRLLDNLRHMSHQVEAAGPAKADRMIDVAILLRPEKVGQLATLAGQVAGSAEPLGMHLQVAGPWPAYSFKPIQAEKHHGP